MADIEWPENVPSDFLQSGFNESPPDNLLRTDMGVGPAKIRRRSTSGIRPIAGTIKITKTALDSLDYFYTHTTSSGALRFDFPEPRNVAITAEVRFAQKPVYTPAGGIYWNVAIKLEIMP